MTGATRDRGVSFPLSHTVTLGITAVVITALLGSVGGYLDDELAGSTNAAVDTVGQVLVADLVAADRLADGSEDGRFTLDVSLPTRVAGSRYTVTLAGPPACAGPPSDASCIVIEAIGAAGRSAVPFRNESPVTAGSIPGGDLRIQYRDGSLALGPPA